MHEIADFLGRHPPFDTLEDAELARVAEGAEIEFAAAGTVLLAQGSPPPATVWVVRRGAVSLADAGAVIDVLGEGEMFGHQAMLGAQPSALTVAADEDTLLYRIPEAAMRAVFARPAALRFVVRSVSGRYEMRLRGGGFEPGGLDPARRPVGELVRSPPLVLSPTTTVRDAAARMVEAGQSSVVIDLGDRLGIVTDLDFRDRIVAAGAAPETALSAIMTAPARTVSVGTDATDALLEMLDRGIRHLPVVDAHRRVIGVVSDTDLMAVEARTPFHLRRAIARAAGRDDVAAVLRRLPPTVVGLHDARIAPATIERVITAVHDAAVRRLLELADAELGSPPERFTWLALGSHARREAVPSSDSDSAIAWAGASEDPALREAMQGRARWVSQGLARGGLPECDQGASATKALFARSVEGWRARAASWLEDPAQDKALILVSVLVDGRAVWDAEVAAGRLAEVMEAAPRHPALLRGLARMALVHQPPTGFLRNLVLSRSGERTGVLDIKRVGVLPVVDLARWAGMAAGVASASTVDRLHAAERAGTLQAETAATLLTAFDLFRQLRMTHQVEALRAGRTPDDRLDPAALEPLTRRYLKDAFRAVASVQRGIANQLELRP